MTENRKPRRRPQINEVLTTVLQSERNVHSANRRVRYFNFRAEVKLAIQWIQSICDSFFMLAERGHQMKRNSSRTARVQQPQKKYPQQNIITTELSII